MSIRKISFLAMNSVHLVCCGSIGDMLYFVNCLSSHCWISLILQKRELLLQTLHFTALLIEHSFSRHLYNSVEHLIQLLEASDMQVTPSGPG